MSVMHSGQHRHEYDWYIEPSWCVDLLIDVEDFNGPIHDPCCGMGTIPEAFKARGIGAIGSDIVDRGYGHRCDYLSPDYSAVPMHDFIEADAVVCNPPYGRINAKRFIGNADFDDSQLIVNQAKLVGKRKICILQKLTWLSSQRRKSWFEDTGLSRVWVLSKRPSMPPGDKLVSGEVKAKGGSVDYAWYVWERGFSGKATLGFLA